MTGLPSLLLAGLLLAWPAGSERAYDPAMPEAIGNDYFEAINLLRHKKVNYRRRGALELKEVGDRRAAPYLAEALSDKDSIVRARAAECLVHLGAYDDRVTVPALCESLAGEPDDAAYRAKILAVAHFSGHNETSATLLSVFQAMNPEDQARLVGELHALLEANLAAFDRLRPVFVDALSSGNERAAALAVAAFGKHGTAQDLERIKGLSTAESTMTRLAAIRHMGRYLDEDVSDILEKTAADDANPLVRAEAVQALARHRREDLLYDFMRAAGDVDALVRRAGAVGMGVLRDESAVLALRNLLTDADEGVRVEAAHSLALLGQDAGYDLLVWAMRESPDRLTRRLGAHGLLALPRQRQTLRHFQATLARDRDPVVREFCFRALERAGMRVER